ncbi:MAG: hypothetical protein ABJ013_04210 [Halioglobus sp.]
MKLPTYQWVGQMLAALGLIILLALVAYELKLSRDLGMATLLQETAANKMQYAAGSSQDAALMDAYFQMYEDPSLLTKKQVQRLLWDTDSWMEQAQAKFIQIELGVLDNIEWEHLQLAMQSYTEAPCYAEYFKGVEGRWRSDFKAVVVKLWGEASTPECPYDDWK